MSAPSVSAASAAASAVAESRRARRVERALFRGASLGLENPAYRHAVQTLIEMLLAADLSPADLTVRALGLSGPANAHIIARETGVAAGLQEAALLLQGFGVEVSRSKADGDAISAGDTLLQLKGAREALLSLERVALNVIQRMSGIATAARRMQRRASAANPAARIAGTRKTPWGLLDKRALHLGGAGTHRLGLGDAILVKNNHLALLARKEPDAVRQAIEAAWKLREAAAFVEVEVRTLEGALAAAEAFRKLQERDSAAEYPCLIMLDNMDARGVRTTIARLRAESLWESALIEASGGITETGAEEFAAAGADAISAGALTHSARALEISQMIL